MSVTWQTVPFGEMALLRRDTILPSQVAADTPYIGLEHIEPEQLRFNGQGKAGEVDSQKSRFEAGDILFGKLRPYFRKVVRPRFAGVCSTDIWVVRSKPNVEQGFLYYVMADTAFVDAANQGSGGTRMPRADWDHVKKRLILLPPLPEQRAIARLLGSLDDKIECNRRMNATLEQIARVLFKAWFVDFEPFGGEMPEDWCVGTIGECVGVYGGTTPSTKEPAYWEKGTFPWATPKDLSNLTTSPLLATERHLTAEGLKQIGSGLLPKGTVLLSSRAPIGYVAIVEVPTAINQGFIAMTCGKSVSTHYIYHWTLANMDAIKGRANGTTFQEISKTNFRPLPAIVPSQDAMDKFTTQADALYQKIVANERENRTLTELRETLLPRLLNGELQPPLTDGDRASVAVIVSALEP